MYGEGTEERRASGSSAPARSGCSERGWRRTIPRSTIWRSWTPTPSGRPSRRGARRRSHRRVIDDLVSDDRVDAVIISTSEPFHLDPALAAIESRQADPDREAARPHTRRRRQDRCRGTGDGGRAPVGYSMRYLQKYSVGWDNIRQGKLGHVVGIAGRVYNSRKRD